MQYKCGIIGCGFIGWEAPDSHLRAYLDNEGCALRGVCDTKWRDAPVFLPKKPASLKPDEISVDAYVDYWEFLQEKRPDIVSVCTPPETHCDIVCDIAPHVKAIWCEKPVATSVKDAEKMRIVCQANKTLLVINHQREFTRPAFRFSRGIYNTGTHLFSLLLSMFKNLYFYEGKLYADDKEIILEEVDTEEPIFEFDCTHNKERMLPNVLEYIINCLESPNGWQRTNIYRAIQSLKLCKEYEETSVNK